MTAVTYGEFWTALWRMHRDEKKEKLWFSYLRGLDIVLKMLTKGQMKIANSRWFLEAFSVGEEKRIIQHDSQDGDIKEWWDRRSII